MLDPPGGVNIPKGCGIIFFLADCFDSSYCSKYCEVYFEAELLLFDVLGSGVKMTFCVTLCLLCLSVAAVDTYFCASCCAKRSDLVCFTLSLSGVTTEYGGFFVNIGLFGSLDSAVIDYVYKYLYI